MSLKKISLLVACKRVSRTKLDCCDGWNIIKMGKNYHLSNMFETVLVTKNWLDVVQKIRKLTEFEIHCYYVYSGYGYRVGVYHCSYNGKYIYSRQFNSGIDKVTWLNNFIDSLKNRGYILPENLNPNRWDTFRFIYHEWESSKLEIKHMVKVLDKFQ